MSREEIRELAALYAVGGLDGADVARFEALLRSRDTEATSALREFETTMVGLASEDAESPPPGVKAALEARIAAEPRPLPGRAPAPPARVRSRVWPAVWGAAMAAGIAAIVVGLTVSASYEKRISRLTQEATALKADIEHQQQFVAMVRDPNTEIRSLAGQAPAPEARARLLWHEGAGGLLVAAGLPPNPADKAYQLWAIVGQNPPISAGIFTVDAKGTGSFAIPPLPGVKKVDVFAVTLEPAGGRPAPTGQMYLAGKS